ncbi:MAG: hypothetical protein OXC40_02645 [Proteobacteria bacterium]|nr:hypothetical protein [Pseudomonadota bacterium]
MIHRHLGLLGCNISYSRSKVIHLTSAHLLGLQDVSYLLLDMSGCDLSEVAHRLKVNHITGLNITTPFKHVTKVASLMDVVAPTDFSCVNTATLSVTAGKWHLDNTDGLGWLASMQQSEICCESIKHIIFLGFGGATVGILETLKRKYLLSHSCALTGTAGATLTDPLRITILWRQIHDGYHPNNYHQAFVSSFFSDPLPYSIHWQPFHVTSLLSALKLPVATLLVQGTPLPHQGNAMTEFTEAIKVKNSHLIGCMDMTYAPPSDFLRYAEENQIPFATGWDMLIAQAQASQKSWWQQTPDTHELKKTLKGSRAQP